jgi:ABC-type branched-subunit amino acid transport system ATPase component
MGEADDAVVTLREVTKRFDELVAVDRVDLDVRNGEFLALLGPSGCGKTTTPRMITGFEDPTDGEIEIDGGLGHGRAAEPARHQHGLPGLRAVPAHERARQRGLRPQAAQGRTARAAREALRAGARQSAGGQGETAAAASIAGI